MSNTKERKPWSRNRKIAFGVGMGVLAVFVVVMLIGNIMYYWWVYPYIWYKRISFDVANRKCETGHVVFVGDSITDGCDLDLYYPDLHAYNRGTSGDTTSGVLRRMRNSVYDLKPSLVVLLIGTNDYERAYDRSNEHILKNYRAILEAIHTKCPTTKVIAQSVYPIADVSFHDHYRYGHGHIKALNQGIAALCAEFGYTYADVFSLLEDGDEEMDMRFSEDGLHPNDQGYQIISAYLKPLIAATLAG
ncbi:MAG: hypothetical protein J5755_03520 [Clostridia bacterium]|nr:hypothetical protein [Clostridia bacterium]